MSRNTKSNKRIRRGDQELIGGYTPRKDITCLGTGLRTMKVYHYLCNRCGRTFVSYVRGNYNHACI